MSSAQLLVIKMRGFCPSECYTFFQTRPLAVKYADLSHIGLYVSSAHLNHVKFESEDEPIRLILTIDKYSSFFLIQIL